MEPLIRLTPEQETEFRIATVEMYESGGIWNVLECVNTMQKVQIVILQKLNELLEEEKNK